MVDAYVEEARSCTDGEAVLKLGTYKEQSEDGNKEIDLVGLDELFSEKEEKLTINQAFLDEHFDTGDIDRMFQCAVESESSPTAHEHRISLNLSENENALHLSLLYAVLSTLTLTLLLHSNTRNSEKLQRKNQHGRVTIRGKRRSRSTRLDQKDYWKPEIISRINALDVSHLSITDSGNSDLGSEEDDKCCICLDSYSDQVVLQKCSHKFCKECIQAHFKSKPVCPVCFTTYGIITGIQPPGRMKHFVEKSYLPGYEEHDTIVMQYRFQSGTQTDEHPHPGEPYRGTARVAYLPNCPEGQKVLRLLEESFRRRLTFTVGRSRTTGVENTVTWNDIHHKTSACGGMERFGYPDPTYLSRVQEELATHGVTEDSLKDRAKLNLSGF